MQNKPKEDDLEVLAELSCGCRAIQYADYDTAFLQCRLHAAAPKLLAACELAIWTFEKLGNGKAMTAMRKAVALANKRR